MAVHTRHSESAEVQCLAVSTDDGTTWAMAPGGPVLESDRPDFRDPKVFWSHDHWVMVLAAGDRCEVHVSTDLHNWAHTDDIAMPTSPTAWECPDLVPIGDHHALIACTSSVDGSGGTIAVAGSFDGERFEPTQPAARVDLGPDFYAWQSVHGTDDRVLGMAWLNSWSTAMHHPSPGWRGTFTVPRELRPGRTVPVASWPAHELLDHPCVHHDVERLVLVSDSGARGTVTIADGRAVVDRLVPGAPALSTVIDVTLDSGASSCVVADAGSLEVFAADGDVSVSIALPADTGWTVETT